MQMVEIEVLAPAAFQFEFQLFGLAVAAQKIGPAGLDASPNPDQALLEVILFNEVARQTFLARIAGGQIAKRPSGYFGHAQRGRGRRRAVHPGCDDHRRGRHGDEVHLCRCRWGEQ